MGPVLLALAALLALLWVWSSGIGGYAFQNDDHNYRNATIHDLIDYSWPVQYGAGRILVYYHVFWLPAALVGQTGRVARGYGCLVCLVCLWCLAGAPFVRRLLRPKEHFSGLGIRHVWQPQHPRSLVLGLGLSCPWAAHGLVEPRHPVFLATTCLFWVYNQAVPAWLVTLLLLRRTNPSCLVFVSALIIPYAPFPAIGLAALVMAVILRDWRPCVRRFLLDLPSPANILGGGCVLLVFSMYFGLNHTHWGESWITVARIPQYLLFLFVQVGFLTVVFWRDIRRDAVFYAALASLVLIPLYQSGSCNDFCMRVSIPAMVVLAAAIYRGIDINRKPLMVALLQLLVLACSWVTPFNEIWRSASNAGNLSRTWLTKSTPGLTRTN